MYERETSLSYLYNGSTRLPEEVSVALAQATQEQCVDGHMGARLSRYSGCSPRGVVPSRLFLGPDVIIHCHLVRQDTSPTRLGTTPKNL